MSTSTSPHRSPLVTLLAVLTQACLGLSSDPEPDAREVVTTGSCNPNPCVQPQSSRCALDWLHELRAPTQGTCNADSGQVVCTFPEALEQIACADQVRGLCLDGVCQRFASLCDFKWGERLSAIYKFALGSQSNERDPASGSPIDSCCFDLDGDTKIDNRFGEVMRELRPFLGDFNDLMARQIAGHNFGVVFDLHARPESPDAVDFLGYQAVIDDRPGAPSVESGFARFRIRDRGFEVSTALPLIRGHGTLVNGHLESEDFRFVFFMGDAPDRPLEIVVHAGRLEAEVTTGPDGHGLVMGGRFGGSARISELVASMNSVVKNTCVCQSFAGTGGAIGPLTRRCNPPLADTCPESDGLCRGMTQPDFCELFMNQLAPDIDTDHDGTPESLSMGFTFETTSATISEWYDNVCPR